MSDQPILVAGIGNIFLGDDAFGVEVVRHLVREPLPANVRVVDYGVRSYDLAYALMDDYQTVIFIDATQRGQPPGTVYLIEPDLSGLDSLDGELVNAHSLNPFRVLGLVKQMGGQPPSRLYLIGCEPAVLETEDGKIGLSSIVEAAIPDAIDMLRSLVTRLMAGVPI